MTDKIHTTDFPVPDFRVIFELLPIPSVMFLADDPGFPVIAANQAYAELVGVTQADLPGRGVFDLFSNRLPDQDFAGSLLESYRRVIRTRSEDRIPVLRHRVSRPERVSERYFSSRSRPVLGSDGQVRFIIQSVEDVSESVQAQERANAALQQLQTSERRFRQLVETSGFGMVIADPTGGLSYVNPSFLELLGYPAEEAAAGLLRWDELTPPGFKAADDKAWQEILSTGRCTPFEKAYVAKSGRCIPVLVSASLLDPVNGRTEVAASIVDLTERKQKETAAFLVRLEDATRAASEPEEVMRTVTQMLGEHLRADRCGYCVFQADEEAMEIAMDYTGPGIHSIVGRYTLSQFGARTAQLLRANLPDVEDDTQKDELPADIQITYRNAGIRAHASVPLHKSGKLVAAIGVHQATGTRKWLPEEVELIRNVANRCWESIERVRAIRALSGSERRLRLAQKAGRIGTFEWLVQEDRITWSPELESLYDLPEGSFEGNLAAWRERVVPEDAERVLAELERCVAQRNIEYGYEFRAVLPNGKERWLRGQAQFSYTESGPDRMIGVNIDVDEQKKAEAYVRQQWHTFDTVLSNMPDSIYVFDRDGCFKYANRTLLSRLQVSLEEVLGRDGSALGYPPDVVKRIQRQIEDVFRTSQSVRDDMPFGLPGGDTRHYEYILVPVLGPDGEVEAVAGSTRDITERKLAEERERKSQEQLRESARLESLGIMAGGIAHDFNNLLTGILGNASLLVEEGSQRDVSFAKGIMLAAERAAELTAQMLAYSGKGGFLIEVFDLNLLIQENLTLLRASLPRSVAVDWILLRRLAALKATGPNCSRW